MQTIRTERNWRAALIPIGVLVLVAIALIAMFALQARSSPALGGDRTTVENVVNEPPVGGNAIDPLPANAIDATTGQPIWNSPGLLLLTDSEAKSLASGRGDTPCPGGKECDP